MIRGIISFKCRIGNCKSADWNWHVTQLINSARVAKFVNSYPNIEVSYAFQDTADLDTSNPVTLSVTLDREADESNEDDQLADAPHFPHRKIVQWWLVVGDADSKTLYGIKKVTVKSRLTTKVALDLKQARDYKLKLYLICDSYSGADQDFDLEQITVKQGESDDEDSDEDEDGDQKMD
jgi:pre-mRNA-splicing helicase BRR2